MDKLGLGSQNGIRYNENMKLMNRTLLEIIRLEERLLRFTDFPFGLSILLLASKG